jgi:hypothetical protein
MLSFGDARHKYDAGRWAEHLMVSAASLPALAKNARTGHPHFEMGKKNNSETVGRRPFCQLGFQG